MASVCKKGNAYYLVYTLNGKQKWESLPKGTIKKQALVIKAQRELQIDRGTFSDKRIEFTALVDKWLDSVAQRLDKKSSLGFYITISVHLKKYFGDTSVKDIDGEQIEAYLASKKDSLSARTRGYHLGVLKQIFAKAKLWKYIYVNPCDDLRRPKVKSKTKIQVPTAEQVAALLEYAHGQTRLLLMTAANTGCRAGELMALKWRCVDLVEATISIDAEDGNFVLGKFTSPKSEASIRVIDIPPALVTALAVAKDSSATELVFVNSQGSPLQWQNFLARDFKPLLRKADLPPITPHSLRHFYAVQLFKAGLNPVYIKEQLGHTDLTMTLNTYADHIPKKVEGMGQKIQDALNINLPPVEVA